MTPDPGFKVTIVLKGEYLQSDAFCRQLLYRTLIGNDRQAIDRQASYLSIKIGMSDRFAYSDPPTAAVSLGVARHGRGVQRHGHCSYINRANVSQASRMFVSDSWPFL